MKILNFFGEYVLTFSKNPLLVCTTSTKMASSFEIVFEASLRSNHGLAGSKANENCRKLFNGTISVEILATFVLLFSAAKFDPIIK